MTGLFKVVGITVVSQIVAFLNVLFEPFKGTILVFGEWEAQASKTAVAAGVIIVAVVAGLNLRASPAQLGRRAVICLFVTLILFGLCAAMHVVIKSGYAPSDQALFWTRDIVWMLIYIIMLVMAGITMAFAVMRYSTGSSAGGARTARSGPNDSPGPRMPKSNA
jgi:hypothetical protein